MVFTKAIEGFIFYLAAANYSPITIKHYKISLQKMAEFLQNKHIESVNEDDIKRYFVYLKDERKVSNATLQYHWKVMRSFYNWTEKDLKDLSFQRPDRIIPQPAYQSKIIIPFTKEEIETMLKKTRSKRNKAMILTLLDTGVRVSELSRLTIRDCDLETGMVKINPYQSGAKSRPRVVFMGRLTRRVVWQYIASRTDLDGVDNAPLFATLQGKPMHRFSIRNILYRLSITTGIKSIHPHRFRHTFAIQYLRNGGDVFTLQRLLGHAKLDIVRRYLDIADSDTQLAHRRASPADRWQL